jgi:ankyrin repeat protein
MSVFLFWWMLGASLCSAIAAIIVTGSLAAKSLQFIPFALLIYWISLGIVEWKLLSPHISGAYQWGLLTIVGGIIGSCLLAGAFLLISAFLLRDFSIVGFGGSNPSFLDILIALIAIIICLFTIGFLLGLGQRSILYNSLSQNIQAIPIVTGLTWLLGSTIPYIVFIFTLSNPLIYLIAVISFGQSKPFIFIIIVTFLGAICSFSKGWILEKLFEETGSLPLNLLLWQELTKVGVFLLIIASIFYPFRYPILQSLGFTRLLYDAVIEGKIDAEDFLSHGGNPNIDDGLSNIIHWAVYQEDLTLIKLLLSHGVDVNSPNFRGDTPLHYSRARNKEVVKLLIDNGADVNARNQSGTTILHLTNNTEIVELLLESGADVNAQNSHGDTPLHNKTLDKEVIQLLLARGANPNIKNKNERTPLHQVESVELAEILIANGADLKAKGWMGFTPLHSSVRNLEITKLLLRHGAEIDARDSIGRTPLHLANTVEVVRLLVEQGAEIDARDNKSWTPLHTVVQSFGSPYKEIAKLLLDRGANVNAKDNKGRTPLDLAYENNRNESNKDTIELLKRYGGVSSQTVAR